MSAVELVPSAPAATKSRSKAITTTPVAVPYAALPLQYRRVRDDILAAVERVFDSGAYILGPQLQQFEREFAAYCGTEYAVGVADGTTALILLLRWLGVGPGDEVITAPNSFVASASCAALLGATPVFVDVNRDDMNLNPERLERAITPRTKAILPVHLAGHPAPMDPIKEIAESHGVPVLEDAAQSVGSSYRGRRTGNLGLAGSFSLHPLKNLHAYGDAGIITTSDRALYEWLIKARNHGLRDRENVEFWSTNSRLDTVQAAILSVNLAHLDQWNDERRAIAARFCRELAGVVQVPLEAPECFHTYQTFVIRAERRAELLDHLRARGVDAKVHYQTPLHMQEVARSLGYQPDDFPVTRRLAERIVSLPLYPEMTEAQQQAVIDGVKSFYAK